MNEAPLDLHNALILDSIKSLILLAIILFLRGALTRLSLRIKGLTPEARRRWTVSIRNSLVLFFVIGMIFIWAHELNTLAVYMVAIAVAIVLATKELILCISGTVLRIGANSFSLGDRIEIAGVRGNVLDQTLLTTTVLEIGPGQMSQQYTGRAVTIPNSLMLTTPLVNETYMKEYLLHVIRIPMALKDDWRAAETALLEAAKEECSPFIAQARHHIQNLEGKSWLDAPSVAPRVSVQLPEPERINLLLRFPAPAQRTARLEQAILRRFLSKFPAAGKNS